MRKWRARDPVERMQKWLILKGWWDAPMEASLRQSCRKEVSRPIHALVCRLRSSLHQLSLAGLSNLATAAVSESEWAMLGCPVVI